ncbi:MAG: hypothetical protein D3904_06280 [Candidatus Electrothrix sp. EH2]|nr:hypothetical protein [Candidatus Electrothrix sp. EH2]
MELPAEIYQWFVEKLIWLRDNPEVTWSGAGIYVLSGVTALLGGIASWIFWKKKSSSSQQEPDNDLSACPSRLRQQLLKRFRNDLDLRLSSLLDERTPLDLDKKLSPQEVDRPYHSLRDILYEQEGCAPQVTDRSIIDIFQDKNIGERLAILGKPGSGKIICLLQLLDHLLKRAKKGKLAPLPVIFECSEWDGKDLIEWMGCQLYLMYGLKEKLAIELVQDGVVFPLFDGLDELLQAKQENFVRAFNKFQVGRSLVLCCRVKEYRHLQDKVALNHAVILQDISEKKLEGYLKCLQFYSLWDFLQRSQKKEKKNYLFELARRPLFLNIMLMLEQEKSLSQDEELQTGKNAEDRLWQLYLDYCLKGEACKKQSLHWLGCVAKYMTAKWTVDLWSKDLQSDMLENFPRFDAIYSSFYILISTVVVVLLFGVPTGLFFLLAFGYTERARCSSTIPVWKARIRFLFGLVVIMACWPTTTPNPSLIFILIFMWRANEERQRTEPYRIVVSTFPLFFIFISMVIPIFLVAGGLFGLTAGLIALHGISIASCLVSML